VLLAAVLLLVLMMVMCMVPRLALLVQLHAFV
jgi:hypothetical protein